MKFYDYLVERGKEDGVEKNVVGAIILNEKNEVLIVNLDGGYGYGSSFLEEAFGSSTIPRIYLVRISCLS